MSSLGEMAESGAIEVLRKAVAVLGERGWTQGVTRDLHTGEVDILGAVALAAGARVSEVDDRPDLLTTSVPPARRAAALIAWETLEWAVDGDPVLWQDSGQRRFHDVARVIQKAADRLAIAIK
jgi:hypothetical protein